MGRVGAGTLAYQANGRFPAVPFGFDVRFDSHGALAVDSRDRVYVSTNHWVAVGAQAGSGSREFRFLPLPGALASLATYGIAVEEQGANVRTWLGCGDGIFSVGDLERVFESSLVPVPEVRS